MHNTLIMYYSYLFSIKFYYTYHYYYYDDIIMDILMGHMGITDHFVYI